jgi:1-acyl-sn-glycerol-3-phosphate acyltransferase
MPDQPLGLWRRLRAAWRMARLTGHMLWGLCQVQLLFPRLDAERRQQRIQRWSRGLFRVLGIGWELQGHLQVRGQLLVANHVSWLDIMAVHAACPQARFVSKADVRSWPLIGRLVDAAGTIYIVREQRRDAMRVAHEMAQALQGGDTVAFFPEGTTGPGDTLLPFHANLLQPVIATGCPVLPVVLRYAEAARSGPSVAAQYIGDTTLLQSIVRLALADDLTVRLVALPPLATQHADRRSLAAHLRAVMAEQLTLI